MLALSLLWLVVWSETTAAAPPLIETITPGIGTRGQAFEVTLTGGRLKDARDLLWYEPGLECTEIHTVSDNELKLRLVARPECRLGAHAFRLRTPGGLSALKVVHVGRFAVNNESEPNDDIQSARAISTNTTVSGVVDSGDVDTFTVSLAAKGRLSVEVQAIRLGGEMTDTVLTVFGRDGKVVATADDTGATRQDPFVSFMAPVAGKYAIQVRESSYQGGPGSTYALHVGDFPRPAIVFPPGGIAGKTATLKLLNDDGSTDLATITIPERAGRWWAYYPEVAGTAAPTPTMLRVGPYACVDESDDATATTAGTVRNFHDWPVAFHGTIGRPGEVDAFSIRARQGDVIQVETFAERIGSKLDTTLEIHDPAGEPIARNDDDATHDSLIVFRASFDGIYRIQIADKRGEGDRACVYRVEVEQPRKDLTLFLPAPARKSQDRQVIAVPRGNRVLAYIGARRSGFDGPIDLTAGSLPDGVRIDMQQIAGGAYLAPIVVEAARDAALGARLVNLTGRAVTTDGPITGHLEQRVDLIAGSADSAYETVDVESLAIVVIEEAPYKVSLSAPKTAVPRDGSICVLATVDRARGYDDAIEISLPYLPPGVEMEGPEIVMPGQSHAALTLLGRPDADPVHWRLAAEARTAPPRRDRREMTLALQAQIDPTVGGAGTRRRGSAEDAARVSSRFVDLAVAEAPVSGRIDPAVVEQGESVTLTCSLEPGEPIPGTAMATLEGLPPRATAKPVEVARGTNVVRFEVAVAPTTPIGEHSTVTCRLAGKIDGQDVVYRVGRGGTLKVNAPGATLQGPDGKPLSPLEALRAKERLLAAPKPGGAGKS